MAKVLLVDADSTIPNLALMKISQYHKRKEDEVSLVKLMLPYYPNRKKNKYKIPSGFTKVYCSIVFEGNKNFIEGDAVYGGTGFDLTTKLPEEIENEDCDYDIYPENDTSYGFITRGCIRKCKFCKVPEKEGYIKKVSSVDKIVKHKTVKFMDNNFLAYEGHKEILKELVDKKIRCQFNQGLDIRLIDKENSGLLSRLNYMGEYIFAFDSWNYKELIEEKLLLLGWRKDWQLKFFVYVHPSMNSGETRKRIMWLKERLLLPYIMRDISCWNSEFSDFYINIASYCNQVHVFKKLDFNLFLEKRHTSSERISESKRIWESN